MKMRDQSLNGAGWGGEDLYFCIGDQCMTPMPLAKLRYGCAKCEPSKLMTSEDAAQKGVPISAGVFDSRVLCEDHQMPIRPRCAARGCSEPIRAEATGRPIRLVGGEHSGKTVYSAVLARELLDPGFFQGTGVSVARIRGDRGDAYLRETVRPLFERGVLPVKTGEPHKIVFRFVRKDGPAEIITLHDMPGEAAPTATIGYFSDKTLFLVNPQAVSTPIGAHPLVGLVQGHAYWGVEAVVDRLGGMGWLDTATVGGVQSVCNQATDVFRDRGWPNCARWEDLAGLLLETARIALGRSDPAEGSDRLVLAGELAGVAEGLCIKPDFTSQFDDWADAMRTMGAPVVDGKLAGHRLALALSKADLLGGSARDKLFRNPTHAEAGSPKVLRAALRDLSVEARAQFLDLGLDDLVQRVEQQVDHVGFFFVSSLARTTETKAKRLAPISAGTAPAGGHQLVRAAPVSPTPEARAPRWELTELLSAGPDSTRAPTPRGVVNPLLWLLLG